MRGFFRNFAFLGVALTTTVWTTPEVSLWFGVLGGVMMAVGSVFGWSDD